jgi:nephrocystin-3
MGTGSSVSRVSVSDDDITSGGLVGEMRRYPVENSSRRRPTGPFKRSRRRGNSTKTSAAGEDGEIDRHFLRELDPHKIKELHDLKSSHDRLKEENRRLQLELKIQTSAINKLREDRHSMMQSVEQACERTAAVEREKDKIQNLFKMYRESKEKELQDLLRAKRELESKLQKLHNSKPMLGDDINLTSGTPQRGSSSDLFSNHPGEWWSPLDVAELSIQPMNTVRGPELAQALMEADGPFTNVSKIDWSVATLTQSQLVWQPCSILKVYVSAGPDMTEEAEILEQLCHGLHAECEAENKFFQFVYLPFENSKATARNVEKYRPIVRRELERCDIFVAFLGSAHNKFMKDEIELGYLNSPASKPAVFVFKNSSADNGVSPRQKVGSGSKTLVATLKSKVKATGKAKIFEEWSGHNEAAQLAYKELHNLVQIELGACSEMDSTLSEFCDEPEIPPSIIQDRRDEAEQVEILSQVIATPGTFGFEKYFEHLDEHVSGSGPLPPLLVLGDEGAGKTQLLAKWVGRQRERSPGTMVLYHFAGRPGSCSSDPVLMMRRLTAEIMRLGGGPYSLSCDASRLETEFPRWLEKVASHRHGGVILVIDSIDRLEAGEQHLGWLLDPLPVDARVVLSANDKTCPESWRMLPTMKMQPLSCRDARSLLKLWLGNTKTLITSEQEVKLVSNGKMTISPLSIVLKAKHLASDSTATTLQARIDACVNYQSVEEIVNLILTKMEEENESDGYKGYVVKVLSLIVCSSNGMSMSEVLHLAPSPLTLWTPLYYALLDRHILIETAGLLRPTNELVN